jgi:putative flippase GtrA
MKRLFAKILKANYLAYFKNNKLLLGRYVFSGLSSMLLELFLFYLMIYFLYANAVVSSNFSLILAGIFNYFLSRYWVFEKTMDVKREVILFAIIFFVSLLINNAIFIFTIHVLKLNPMLSKSMAIVISTGFNYLTKKYLVFKEFRPEVAS